MGFYKQQAGVISIVPNAKINSVERMRNGSLFDVIIIFNNMKTVKNLIYLLLGVSLTCHFLESGKEVGIYSTIIVIILLFFVDFLKKQEEIEYIYPEEIVNKKEKTCHQKQN
jgi:Na+/H+ antiporter NhaA